VQLRQKAIERVRAQFGRPTGLPGRIAGAIMAHRASNRRRNAWIAESRVEEVLETVELADAAGRRVRTYSLGMRQRLGLAAALLGDPELLVLDEPANGLDPAGVHWLRIFLRRVADRGGTVLVSSHLLAEVAQTVDRILIINRGRLVTSGRIDELTRPGQSLEDAYLELTAGGAA
jgi:ABC-2 type transport system ATP-binding protein